MRAQRHDLGHGKRNAVLAQLLFDLVAQPRDCQTAFHGIDRLAGLGRDIVERNTVARQFGEGFGLVYRGQILALHVLDGGDAQLVAFAELAADFDGNLEALVDVAALAQQLQCAETPFAADELVGLAA